VPDQAADDTERGKGAQENILNSSNVVAVTAACAMALAAAPAMAQTYPEKPVRVVVPFPPAGAADIVARHVTQKLSEAFGVQFIVDNRAGAGGAIGTDYAAHAAPDGYTLIIASSSSMSINPHIGAGTPYDPQRSFTPVILIGYAANVLVVHPSVPAKSVKELIAFAKARPGALNIASNGTGTISHLTAELFMQRAGIKMVHVPYKGSSPATIDLMAGQVSLLFAAYPSVSAQLPSGKLKALAVTSAKRIEIAPQLPTVAEAALPGFESSQWWGLYGPAGMAAATVTRLNTELNKILRSADIKKRFAADGVEPGSGAPNDLAVYLKNDFEKWGKVIRAAGIKNE